MKNTFNEGNTRILEKIILQNSFNSKLILKNQRWFPNKKVFHFEKAIHEEFKARKLLLVSFFNTLLFGCKSCKLKVNIFFKNFAIMDFFLQTNASNLSFILLFLLFFHFKCLFLPPIPHHKKLNFLPILLSWFKV